MGIEKFISINELDSKKTGCINANGAIISNASEPKNDNDLATKKYIDLLYDKVDQKTDYASSSGNLISLQSDGVNYLLVKGNQVQILSTDDLSRSEITLASNNVQILSGSASEQNSSGGAFSIVTGNGKGSGNGGDFNVSLGLGGSEGSSGVFVIHGPMQINGVLRMAAHSDPGIPPHQSVYLWLDIKSGLLKARKSNGDELVML